MFEKRQQELRDFFREIYDAGKMSINIITLDYLHELYCSTERPARGRIEMEYFLLKHGWKEIDTNGTKHYVVVDAKVFIKSLGRKKTPPEYGILTSLDDMSPIDKKISKGFALMLHDTRESVDFSANHTLKSYAARYFKEQGLIKRSVKLGMKEIEHYLMKWGYWKKDDYKDGIRSGTFMKPDDEQYDSFLYFLKEIYHYNLC